MDDSSNIRPDKRQSYTYDMFLYSMGEGLDEMEEFQEWLSYLQDEKIYGFEASRQGPQSSKIQISRADGEKLEVLNFAHYNYLGLGHHSEVIKAAQDAVEKYGLGAASAPPMSGTNSIHKILEEALISFYGLQNYGVSLFTSGFGANVGTIQAFVQPGHHVVMDEYAHMSILEGAKASGANLHYFRHNDMESLAQILEKICQNRNRVLVCVEGVYSTNGNYGRIKETVELAKKFGAFTLVDEAHSSLLAGDKGRGVAEMQGVLEQVDLHILTLSKSFSGVGGALIANEKITRYVNWYAKCRLFSCSLDPGVTGGMIKVLELARGSEGDKRRKKIVENASYFRSLLKGKVDIGSSETWIVPVIFGPEKLTLGLYDFVQRKGLDVSVMQFPAVPKNEARMRIFITSEHSREQIDQAAQIVLETANHFNF